MKRHHYQKAVGDNTDNHSLLNFLERYLQQLQIQGRTENAIYNVERYMRDFIGWCDSRALRRPEDITRPILDRYQRSLFYYRKANGEPLSINSRRSKLVPVKAYFKWLSKENYLLYNPASEVELPKKQHRLPKATLTVNEVEKVMSQTDVSQPLGLRDRAIMELLYSTGIRRMEIVNLNLDQIDFSELTLFVRLGKHQKDRILPIGDRALHWLKRYVYETRPEYSIDPSNQALFLSQIGTRLNPSWLSSTVSRYIKKAATGKTGGCHLFRHTMATLMLDNGADITYIQAMLGHSDPKTTQIYTRISIKKLRDIHKATHPAKLPESSVNWENQDIEDGVLQENLEQESPRHE